MDTSAAIIIAVIVAIVVIAAIALYLYQGRRRSGELRDTFGSEYDRTLARNGDRKSAESELAARRERVDSFELQELDHETQARLTDRWRLVQAEFVDEPAEAVQHADTLLVETMQARGYEVDTDPDTRAADISVYHGDEAEDYRHARVFAARNRRGEASTEDLRQAMQHYKRVFHALLEPTAAHA